ncbi:MAG: 4-hydroxythreonine-4-phosphate dehydrogenase PdxA [Rhodospirillales bacterium]|nr:4-hydroxythreonine-4-phosphate dehydrogenase PdxA [Rhodospirillales bacterium]
MTRGVLPLALTMGEPAGIGGEITLKAWLRRAKNVPPFVVIDDADRLRALAAGMGLAVPVQAVNDPGEAPGVFATALPVLHRPLARPSRPGLLDPANAAAVVAAIEQAVALVLAGRAAAVVTNPLHKQVMYEAGFKFPGHTEFLGDLAGARRAVMMLACPGLRVVPVTVHLGLGEAVRALRTEDIVACGEITAAALRSDFGIAAPRLAVAALNPHAGEGGTLGREEIDVIAPAVAALRAKGIGAFGPAAADTLFHARARQGYDAALCMYHDQALIPLKTIDFDRGVNATLGLPFVRTSPDHGTALDIAGTGKASELSLMAALEMAADMAARRRGQPHA